MKSHSWLRDRCLWPWTFISGLTNNKANSAQLGLTGAWAELGNNDKKDNTDYKDTKNKKDKANINNKENKENTDNKYNNDKKYNKDYKKTNDYKVGQLGYQR